MHINSTNGSQHQVLRNLRIVLPDFFISIFTSIKYSESRNIGNLTALMVRCSLTARLNSHTRVPDSMNGNIMEYKLIVVKLFNLFVINQELFALSFAASMSKRRRSDSLGYHISSIKLAFL
jgi:hypothetical protein